MPVPDASSVQVETYHEDMIHDAQMDYYSTRLATCSSDRTVKVFEVVQDGQPKLIDTLRGHEGPVWQLAFGHPSFGSILASCSYDGKVFVWREAPDQGGRWERIKEHSLHGGSVNSICWAPHELGPILACASSDGKISVLTFNHDGTWDAQLFPAHAMGVNGISWAPSTPPAALTSPNPTGPSTPGVGQRPPPNTTATQEKVKKFVSAGCDGLVKIWAWRDDSQSWVEEDVLKGHTDWVRDVAWAPNIGMPKSYIASAGQDKQVLIWSQESPRSPWIKTAIQPPSSPNSQQQQQPGPSGTTAKFNDAVWRVSWSVSGNVLAVACGDGKVTLWKEDLQGRWECVTDMAA